MRMSWLAAGLLVAVGVGAVGLVVFQPSLGGTPSTEYLTSTATVTDVIEEAVATGSVSSTATYGLAFGADPQKVASTSTGSTGSTASTGNASGSAAWEVTAVNVKVGDKVKAGDLLASAASPDATAQLAVAQANLATAQARLEEDEAGATANEKAQASSQVKQAQQQLAQAKQNQTFTKQENSLSLRQAQAAVDKAMAQLATDAAAGAPETVLDQDRAAIATAQDQLASTKLKISQSNAQAANSVTSASLALANARTSYSVATAPASDAQLASDRAAVLTAQVALDDAQATLDNADLRAPVDGLVISVEIENGVTAPSGYAIEIQGTAMEVVASFTESDMSSLAVGQAATITLTATDQTAAGTVARISPVSGSTSTGGSVVSYEVAVSMDEVPDGTLAGMTAEIGVTTAEAQDVVAVPAIALEGSAGSYSVQVVDATGATASRSVDVGLMTSSLAEIKSGLTEGETVVVGTTSDQAQTTTTNGGNGLPGLDGGGPGGAFPGGGPVVRP